MGHGGDPGAQQNSGLAGWSPGLPRLPLLSAPVMWQVSLIDFRVIFFPKASLGVCLLCTEKTLALVMVSSLSGRICKTCILGLEPHQCFLGNSEQVWSPPVLTGGTEG